MKNGGQSFHQVHTASRGPDSDFPSKLVDAQLTCSNASSCYK